MKSYSQFLSELGVASIQYFKASTGRQIAKIKDASIIIASNFDAKKPAFVQYNEEKGVHVVCNSKLEIGMVL